MLTSVRSMEREYKFPAIPGGVEMIDLPEKVVADLSSDQNYGHR